MKNPDGFTVTLTNTGGIITELLVPDRDGTLADVVLGLTTPEDYLRLDHPYFGALIGRFANRIGGATFQIDGKSVSLFANDKNNSLHGGKKGFDKKIWQAEILSGEEQAAVRMHTQSPHGEEGYPGNLKVTVTYRLNAQNELSIDYRAETDQPTVVNFTQHSYFNLGGHDSGSILDHEVQINASYLTPVDDHLIPTGELLFVEDTPFDFRRMKPVRQDIESPHPQLQRAGGYDHNWVLDKEQGTLGKAAEVRHPASGRRMEVWTTEPGIQFYTGNFLDGSIEGKGRVRYEKRSGLCLETQHFPDSPNQPHFPSTRLEPDRPFSSQTVFKFFIS